MFQSLSAQEFSEKMYDEDVIVVDVRAPEEHHYFWVLPKVDLYINMYEENFFDELWKLDRNKKYFIYCRHANRTAFLLNYMKNAGFENVVDLAGWTDGWLDAGYELVSKEFL